MKKKLFVLGSIIIIWFNVTAQECNCSESFNWMVNTFEKNDAGFQYVIDKKGIDDYNKFTTSFKEKAKGISTVNGCKQIMDEWLLYFRSGHLWIEKNAKTNKLSDDAIRQEYKDEKTIDITENQLKAILGKKKNKNPVEGIWVNDYLTIGIISDEKSNKKFTAFILKGDSVNWVPKQIKAELTLNDDNKTYDADFYKGNRSKKKGRLKFVDDSATVFNLFGYWTRIYPENNLSTKDKIQLAFTKPHPTLPFIEKLSDKTVYLRIPSFLTDQKINIDSVLLKNDKLITSTPNLIIDIRNGTGGNTHSYKNIIPYLYTNTIRGMDNQYYATELNIKGYEHFAKEASDTSDSNYCNHVAKMMKEHLGEFITLSNQNYSTKTLDKTLPYPQRIAVICNNYNGSADEGFLLDAKQSTKVKVFGTPTMGVLDIANLASVYSPDDKFILHYGMTRSLRIPDFCIDNIGIQPDYFIDDSTKEEDWIGYTQKILEQ